MTKAVYRINIVKDVTALDLSYILSAALESGVYGSQWLRAYEAVATWGKLDPEHKKKEDYTGFNIARPKGDFPDFAEGDEVPAVHRKITLQSIADALSKLGSDPGSCDVYKTFTFNLDDYDAPAADIVVQVAVFGKVVYG